MSRKTATRPYGSVRGWDEELDPGGPHAVVAGVEVIDSQEEADPTGMLVAHGRDLFRAVRTGEQDPGLPAWRPDDHPPLGTAVVGPGRRILRQLESQPLGEERDRLVVVLDRDRRQLQERHERQHRRVRPRTHASGTTGERTLALPRFVLDMLDRRATEHGTDGALLPNAHGGWRDPSNTLRAFREARDAAGYDWVTPHVFRKTVATRLDEAGHSARAVADQLGHAKVSMTQDTYMGRGVANPAAATDLSL
jgi:hypothetical protein